MGAGGVPVGWAPPDVGTVVAGLLVGTVAGGLLVGTDAGGLDDDCGAGVAAPALENYVSDRSTILQCANIQALGVVGILSYTCGSRNASRSTSYFAVLVLNEPT